MNELFFRTEDIGPEEVLQYFVPTAQDGQILQHLKGRYPVVLSGSRGVGKSFLLRVAEAELLAAWKTNRELPVYLSFIKSTLIHGVTPGEFQNWMLARISAKIVRALRQHGLLAGQPKSIQILAGGVDPSLFDPSPMETLADDLEKRWQSPKTPVDDSGLPTVEAFKEAIEDTCTAAGLKRIVLLIDEAAHILIPAQQRQFFTLFRDLRSPFLAVKAAVYPGVTAFGESFQPAHDATMLSLDRDALADSYVTSMKEIVDKQAETSLRESLHRREELFSILAYAASGNPRVLLKTITRLSKIAGDEVNALIREYYRNDIWVEHSLLPEKLPGHKPLVDWGRRFIEQSVLPDLQAKNDQYLQSDKSTTAFFWIHRDAPQQVKEALRLLAYTGIVREHALGIKATRGEIGTRWMVNLGCLFSLEKAPTSTSLAIATGLTPKRMAEFGANHASYDSLITAMPTLVEPEPGSILESQLARTLDVLDIPSWQKDRMKGISLVSLGDVLGATEAKLQSAYYVGEKRSRRIKNAAQAAVLEYLSG